MPAQLPFEKLVLATHNKGKVREIGALMAPLGVRTISAGDLGLAEPEETETTFAGNARLKALASARGSGLPALSDDSGLAVDALGGDPGIYAARWAQLPSCEGGGLRNFSKTSFRRLTHPKCLSWPSISIGLIARVSAPIVISTSINKSEMTPCLGRSLRI